MVIIDGHAHVFPDMRSAPGVSEEVHKWMLGDRHASAGAEPIPFGEPPDVNFRLGRFGRLEWNEGGIGYYRQSMAPSLQDQTASPEFMLAQMDFAGIDAAVLQGSRMYGKTNDYFAKCIRRYPDRFVGIAEFDESEAAKGNEIQRLRHAIKDLGLKGLFYGALRLYEDGNPGWFNDASLDTFWQEVSDLGIPVLWNLVHPMMPAEVYMAQMMLFSAWAERFPDIPSIMVHGLWAYPFRENSKVVKFPKELMAVHKKQNVFVEILYHIQGQNISGWDYPFPQSWELIKQQYEELGPQKLIWGSDMPIMEEQCTYKQSLCYLKDYCDFISSEDMALILGENIAKILKIKYVPRTKTGQSSMTNREEALILW